MKVPELLDNLAIISQLGDNPGTDDGLSAEALKAKFDEAVLIIQRYINSTLLPSLNQVVSPEDGLTMKNDIDMGGHRVKNMAAPEEDGDAVSLAYAKQHFGGSDLADSTYPDCYYRMVDGVKEWINPPMIPGVEYRTTERFDGKVVYTRMLHAGAFPTSGNMDVLLGELSDMPYAPFREEVIVTSSDGLNRRNNLARGHWSDGIGRYLGIEPPSNGSIAGYGVAVTIWYTKD